MIRLPRLYAIIDSSCFLDADALFAAAQELEAGGCSLVQYRNKSGKARIMLEQGHQLRSRLGRGVKLMMNDRADLCLAAGFDGVHLGQDDLSPESARRIVGPEFWGTGEAGRFPIMPSEPAGSFDRRGPEYTDNASRGSQRLGSS